MGRIVGPSGRYPGPRVRVFAVCEGLTENQYLRNFGRNNRRRGSVDVTVLEKRGFDRGLTDREQLFYMADGEVRLRRDGVYTPFCYVSRVLHALPGTDDPVVFRELNRVRWSIVRRLGPDRPLEDFAQADAVIRSEIARSGVLRDHGVAYDPGDPPVDPAEVWGGEGRGDDERVFIVFDRDPDFRNTDERYRRVFELCRERGYEVLMSTPYFELWLLLHHPGLDLEPFRCGLPFLEADIRGMLSDLEGDCPDWDGRDPREVKAIGYDRLSRYYGNPGLAVAIEQSKGLPTDLESLLSHPGTNVGLALESVLAAGRPSAQDDL